MTFCAPVGPGADPANVDCSVNRFDTDGRLIRAFAFPGVPAAAAGIAHDVIYVTVPDAANGEHGSIYRLDEGAGVAVPLAMPRCERASEELISETDFVIQNCTTGPLTSRRVLDRDTGAVINTVPRDTSEVSSDGTGGLWVSEPTAIEHRTGPKLDAATRVELTGPAIAAALSVQQPVPIGGVIARSGDLWANFCSSPTVGGSTCGGDPAVTTAHIDASSGAVLQKWTVQGTYPPRMMVPVALSYLSADGNGAWYTTARGLFRYNTDTGHGASDGEAGSRGTVSGVVSMR